MKQFYHAFRTEYPAIVGELVTEGAVAWPSAKQGAGSSNFRKYAALWDTGANSTVITSKVVEELKLIPTGKTIAAGVNSETEVNKYLVDIGLPNGVSIQNVEVLECDLNSPGIDILIGMDIIQSGDFSIAKKDGKTIFTFAIPSFPNPVDLLEKAIAVNPKIKR